MNLSLKISKLCFHYAKQEILKGISLDIHEGDFIGIIGPNGSGKTTLLKNICRLLEPTKGAIWVAQKPLKDYNAKELAKKLGVLSESPGTEFKFTAMDIVLMGRNPHLELFQEPTVNDLKIVKKAMNETNTYGLRNCFIDELSAGERQRVFIAQTLAKEPRIILLDEPTSHLDLNHETEIFNLIAKLNREKCITVITVLHDLNLASHYASKLVLLEKGKIHAAGPAGKVLTKKNIENVYRAGVSVKLDGKTKKPIIRPLRN